MSQQRTRRTKHLRKAFGLLAFLVAGITAAFAVSGSAASGPAASTTTTTATTATTKAVDKPQNTSPPSVSGTPQEGQKWSWR